MPLNRPHPRRRRRRQDERCGKTGKVCYSHSRALNALVSMQRNESDPDPFRPLHAYRCAHGRHYHVGHRPFRLMNADPSSETTKGVI